MGRKERGEERLLTVMGRDNKPVSRLVWIETFRETGRSIESIRGAVCIGIWDRHAFQSPACAFDRNAFRLGDQIDQEEFICKIKYFSCNSYLSSIDKRRGGYRVTLHCSKYNV